MVKRNHVFLLMLLMAFAFVLAACGAGDEKSSGNSDSGESGLKDKKILVGTEATFAPFEYMDDKGNIVGIDKDIIDAIFNELGMDYEMRHVGWEAVFQQVQNGELDMGASGITITKERKETFDFTEPYFEATQVIVVTEDSPIESAKDLEGKKVSVQINSTGHQAAKKLLGETNPNILAYENLPLAIQEVINGTAQAAIGDNAVVYEYLKNNPNAKLKVIEDDAFEKEYYGLMVKKGNKELLDLLNEGLQKIKENGKLAEITGQELE
ncbi:basic amino acid ABC transporter substrate-binding protein [Ureibacillus sp. FSL K6-3587]|jgi:polar amino acid transport system substrate-binding protein|uniref:basic amino acid ABC transporter substrate-binding protein n=1 Tax=Ureibacillus sp. FSL K6-3587 TaxID=2954681 RepID=UPI003158B4FD